MLRVRTVGELAQRVAHDPELEKKLIENPVKTIAALAAPPQTDVWIYRMVVIILGIIIIGAMFIGVYLSVQGHETPQFVVAVGSAAAGALTGLLAPSPGERGRPL
jgi:hypothetical protein